MSYLPPEKKDKNEVSNARLIIWLVAGAVGVWLVGSGLYGIIVDG